MTPAEWCIRRPVATAMIFLSCLVLGGLSSRLLPLELFPEIDVPFLYVQLPYPGSSPRQVEQSVVRPAEEALATLKGARDINSRATPDGGGVFLTFDWREDIAIKAVEARERLEAIRDDLPDDLRRIDVLKFNTADEALLTLRISSNRDLSESYELLTRHLVRPVERVPGVAQVELQGVEPREIRIELDADRVEAHGISLTALEGFLRRSNFAVSAGTISAGGERWRVNPVGAFGSLEEIRALVVDAAGTRLEDIAEVRFEPRERTYARHLDRRYAVGLEIFKERGANLVEVAERVVAAVEAAGRSREMQGIRLFFLNNQAEGVKTSLRALLNAGLLGAALSLVVLYFFLRNWATTLMVSLAVPISITVTLGAMYLLGLSLNILSMMGLMLAVGMLVDNGVVVSESIFTEREKQPDDPVGASVRGVRAVGLAVLAGTLTSMAVFLPNLFGEMNQIKIFLQHVAAAICISLATSLVIAQTLIPLVASRVRPPTAGRRTTAIERLKARYARFLAWTLGHRGWTWAGILAILLSWAIPLSLVETDMFPETFDRELRLEYNLHGEYPLEKIRPAVDRIEAFLYANAEAFDIDKVYTYYDEEGDAESTILLVDQREATKPARAVRELIEAGLPKIAIGQPAFEVQRTAGAEGVTFSLVGESSERLVALAEDVVFALGTVSGLKDVRSEAGAGTREVAVSVDRERARAFGFSSREVARAIAVALRGTQLDEFRSPTGEVPIFLRFRAADTQTIDQLQRLRLTAPDGREVPLLTLADVRVRPGPVAIQRTARETALGIRASLEDGVTMDAARESLREALDAFEFPPGYGWKFGRGFQFQDDTAQSMLRNIVLAVLFIYLIMAALFESMVHPLAIVTSILFSVVGVHWFFLATGTTFSLMAFIGILILIGVVVNNGIVLIDHVNQLRRSGLLRTAAVVQAGRDRIRPILMTVGTTVLGLLPLCFGTTQIGGDGPPYFPMARAIVGGLVFSTLVSLCVLPTIYVTLDDLSRWGRERLAGARARLAHGSAPDTARP